MDNYGFWALSASLTDLMLKAVGLAARASSTALATSLTSYKDWVVGSWLATAHPTDRSHD